MISQMDALAQTRKARPTSAVKRTARRPTWRVWLGKLLAAGAHHLTLASRAIDPVGQKPAKRAKPQEPARVSIGPSQPVVLFPLDREASNAALDEQSTLPEPEALATDRRDAWGPDAFLMPAYLPETFYHAPPR